MWTLYEVTQYDLMVEFVCWYYLYRICTLCRVILLSWTVYCIISSWTCILYVWIKGILFLGGAYCHDTVSRLVLYCSCAVTGYCYILNNFVVYREPYVIVPFECALDARMRVIGQAPCIDVARFPGARVRLSREDESVYWLEFVLYRTLVWPGVSGWYLSAACNGAVVAEVFIPAFGQR